MDTPLRRMWEMKVILQGLQASVSREPHDWATRLSAETSTVILCFLRSGHVGAKFSVPRVRITIFVVEKQYIYVCIYTYSFVCVYIYIYIPVYICVYIYKGKGKLIS